MVGHLASGRVNHADKRAMPLKTHARLAVLVERVEMSVVFNMPCVLRDCSPFGGRTRGTAAVHAGGADAGDSAVQPGAGP